MWYNEIMVGRLAGWAKGNKLSIVLVGVIVWLVWSQQNYGGFFIKGRSFNDYRPQKARSLLPLNGESGRMTASPTDRTLIGSYGSGYKNSSRLVARRSRLSLLVKNVADSRRKIVDEATRLGGYMVSSSFNRPKESPFAQITISVPSRRLDEALVYLRSLAVKVTSENLSGHDVTDQYTDIQKHINILEKTKAKYEEIRDQASKVEDLMTVTRELTSIQNQIDNYKGQEQRLKNQVNMARVTVYLSTDELALPYAPDHSFRPKLVFKQAVRSLVSTFYSLIAKSIWLLVYAVIWGPILLIVWFIYAKRRKPVV